MYIHYLQFYHFSVVVVFCFLVFVCLFVCFFRLLVLVDSAVELLSGSRTERCTQSSVHLVVVKEDLPHPKKKKIQKK